MSPWVGGHHCHPSGTGPLPTSVVLDGQGDDGDTEQQGQGDSDSAEYQLQLAAQGQAAQQRPWPLPKPHLGGSRTCHRTVWGPNLAAAPSLPYRSPVPALAAGHGRNLSGGWPGHSPCEMAAGAGAPPSRKEGRWPGHTLCRILAASQHIPGDSQDWLGCRPCSCCPPVCGQALAEGKEGGQGGWRGEGWRGRGRPHLHAVGRGAAIPGRLRPLVILQRGTLVVRHLPREGADWYGGVGAAAPQPTIPSGSYGEG